MVASSFPLNGEACRAVGKRSYAVLNEGHGSSQDIKRRLKSQIAGEGIQNKGELESFIPRLWCMGIPDRALHFHGGLVAGYPGLSVRLPVMVGRQA